VSGKIPGEFREIKIYVRAWNRNKISGGAYYGDSEVFEAETSQFLVPLPSDILLGSFRTSMVY
jgi:hypothetical protein